VLAFDVAAGSDEHDTTAAHSAAVASAAAILNFTRTFSWTKAADEILAKAIGNETSLT
jgi:hypothetical protein